MVLDVATFTLVVNVGPICGFVGLATGPTSFCRPMERTSWVGQVVAPMGPNIGSRTFYHSFHSSLFISKSKPLNGFRTLICGCYFNLLVIDIQITEYTRNYMHGPFFNSFALFVVAAAAGLRRIDTDRLKEEQDIREGSRAEPDRPWIRDHR